MNGNKKIGDIAQKINKISVESQQMKALHLIFIVMLLHPHASFAQQSSCDYKVEILVDKEEFEKEEFTWRMKATKLEGKSTNITGTAEIQDSSGKTIKTYKPWTSDPISKQKTSSEYSPNLKEGKEYKITAEIDVDCDDANQNNNIDISTIKIKGEKQDAKSTKSKTENPLQDISNNIETAEIKNNKNTNGELRPATANKPQAKKSTAKAAVQDEENTIQLSAKSAKKNAELKSTAHAVQSSQVIYESSNEKAKALIILFLLTLSILLNIILIWKR